jgi:hypothetical protein
VRQASPHIERHSRRATISASFPHSAVTGALVLRLSICSARRLRASIRERPETLAVRPSTRPMGALKPTSDGFPFTPKPDGSQG